MNKNELWRLYCERDKEFEKAKGRRTIITIAGFAAFYFYVFYAVGKPANLRGIGLILLASLIIAGFHFFVNASIFSYLFNKGRAETDILERIKKQMSELE